MKIHNYYHIPGGALTALLLLLTALLLPACSDNVEQGLYADDESHLRLSVTSPYFSDGRLSVGSAQSATTFTVTSTTRWIVEVTNCEGAWCQIVYGDSPVDEAGHLGDGTFTVETMPNRAEIERECDVTVYAVNSLGEHIPGMSVEIHLIQARQSIIVDYAGYPISSFGTQPGTQPLVTVKANQPWTVTCSHDWVSIIPGEGMDGDGYAPAPGDDSERTFTFRISVEANPGTSVRTAEVTLSSPSWAFVPIRLNVTQEASTDVFFVTTPPDVESLPAGGGTVEFTVYSPREVWTVTPITAGDWVRLDRTSGEASAEPVVIRATIAPNTDTASRQGALRFIRGGDRGDSFVAFSQDGRQSDTPEPPGADVSPRVSEAWIINGWTSTWAQLRAYYLSPVTPLTGCGAFIHPVGDEEAVRNIPGRFGDGGQIIVDLTDLTPQTEYKAWGYVEYTESGSIRVTTGGATLFTTPTQNGDPTSPQPPVVPNPGDNNPPSNK